jgi:hypothetical protein
MPYLVESHTDNVNGVQAQIHECDHGNMRYAVRLRDLDSNCHSTVIRSFPYLADARDYALSLVAGKVPAGTYMTV